MIGRDKTLIPEPFNHTSLAMDDAIVATAKNGDSAGINMSAAASTCDREIWMQLHWATQPEKPSGERERRFRTGNQYERWLLDDLRQAGADVLEYDEGTGRQIAVELANGHLRGRVDGLATGIKEAPHTQHVVECKSMKAATYRSVIKHGVEKAKPEHWLQMQLYMMALGINRALYIAANKDTDEIYTERVELDMVAAAACEARMVRIVEASRPPAKVSDDPDAFACKFCKAHAICHEGAWPRNNCRTCMFSSPGAGATWQCERMGKTLTYQEMQEGCPAHRFIDSLVPGEQIDVRGEDQIVYRLRDGSEWVDGGE